MDWWRRITEDRTAWWLALAAAVVFAPGLWWGLPHATGPVTVRGWDVDAVTGVSTLAELSNLLRRASPDWYVAYPLFHYLVLGAAALPVMATVLVTGGMGPPTGDYPFGFRDPVAAIAALAISGRLVTLAMAVGTVVAGYRVARRLGGRAAGVVAALALMLTEPVVFYARTGNLDVPMVFWTMLALAAAAAIAGRGWTVRRGVMLGLAAAAAVGTKDQAYGALVPLLLVLGALTVLRAPVREWRGRLRGPLATVVSGAGAYLVTSGFLVSPARFAAHLRFVAGYERTFYNVRYGDDVLRPAGPAGWPVLTADVASDLLQAVGPLLALLGVAGIVVTWRRHRVLAGALVAALLGSVALVVFPVRHMQYRYVLVPAALLALTAGVAVAAGLERGGWWRRGTAAVTTIALLWIGVRAADLTWQMLRDARYEAGGWLTARAMCGDRLGFFGAAHQLPRMPADVVPVRLGDGADAEPVLRDARPRWVYVAPDYFADPARVRSAFLPDTVYRKLQNGSLGYEATAVFPSRSPLGRRIHDLPYINPQVQVFERRDRR